jgi:hypothetical protein
MPRRRSTVANGARLAAENLVDRVGGSPHGTPDVACQPRAMLVPSTSFALPCIFCHSRCTAGAECTLWVSSRHLGASFAERAHAGCWITPARCSCCVARGGTCRGLQLAHHLIARLLSSNLNGFGTLSTGVSIRRSGDQLAVDE